MRACNQSNYALEASIRKKVFRGCTGPIISDLTLNISKGEFVSIIGPSGCGKSTLLRILQGLDRDFSGEVTISGTPLTKNDKRIRTVFQEHRLLPWKSVYENVAFGAVNYTASSIHSLLRLVGMEAHARRYPYQLSGGMAQRVALARALAADPALLLLDEPFIGLDPSLKQALGDILKETREYRSFTCVMITHDLEEATRLSDRIVVMEKS